MKPSLRSRIAAAALPLIAPAALPAMAAAAQTTHPAQKIFADFYSDMALAAVAALAVAGLAYGLRSLREAGYLSDRWRFGDECDND